MRLSMQQDPLLLFTEPRGVARTERWTSAAARCAALAPRLLIATAMRRRRMARLLDAKPVSLHVEAGAGGLAAAC